MSTPAQKFDLHFEGIARHFSPAEIRFMGTGNETGNAKGTNTLPPANLWDNIVPTLDMADQLRELFGKPLKILSAYRSPAYNKAIGGAPNSFHRKFMALDLAPLKGGSTETKRLQGCTEILINKGILTGGVGRYGWGVHLDCGPRRDW